MIGQNTAKSASTRSRKAGIIEPTECRAVAKVPEEGQNWTYVVREWRHFQSLFPLVKAESIQPMLCGRSVQTRPWDGAIASNCLYFQYLRPYQWVSWGPKCGSIRNWQTTTPPTPAIRRVISNSRHSVFRLAGQEVSIELRLFFGRYSQKSKGIQTLPWYADFHKSRLKIFAVCMFRMFNSAPVRRADERDREPQAIGHPSA